ncbi:MAG TPA: LuxR C-terminal-related transcriptional regulator, partial [Ramlibacter sp.]|nr:LuxR C-terminal-related transcriptional regulator [Ramlibacter sp.]
METDPTRAPHIATAKLNPRLSSPRPVPRPQIIDNIRAAQETALVLVQGPAGFGKTTVMLQYFAQLGSRGIATGWLTLDRADNELERFLAYMAEALRAIDPALPPASPTADGDGQAAVLELANRLAGMRGRFVLFLDDFETLESPVVLGLVRQLVALLPPEGQIVIGSRVVPDIGLGRLRAHGKLLEIAPADLRFNATETATFLLQQRGLALRNDDILRLQQRTEGWPAALWLVSLALRDRADPQQFVATFDGSSGPIADYLVEDVLSRLPARLRDFLLRTSVLSELGAPLCNHLLEIDDSAQMLAAVARAHLFLVAQDPEHGWYRFHPLFAGFLRAQLAHAAPREAPRLHRRAADWWLQQGQPARAIEHALQAQAPAFLLELLSAHAPQTLWQGRARTLARWWGAAQLGERLAATDPQLAQSFAWALTLTHRYDESLKLLDQVRAAREGGQIAQEPYATADGVQRSFMLAMADRLRESCVLGHEWAPRVSADQPFSYGMLGASYGYCLVAENRFDEAGKFLAQARERVLQIGGSFIGSVALCLEGALDVAQGRLRNAITRFRAALAVGGGNVLQQAGSAVAAAFLAEALYEGNQLDEAERLLQLYLPLLRDAAAPDQLITSYAVLARIAAARGQEARAEELLTEMEVTGHQRALPRMVATAQLERARLALLAGRVEFARDQIASAADERTWAPFAGLVTHANDVEAPFIAALRLKIRTGRIDAVLAPLKAAIREAQAQQRHRRAHKLNILLAQALCLSGQTAQGLRRLRDALGFAAAEGFVRSFVDEGPETLRAVAELRQSLAPADPLAMFADQVLAAGGVELPAPAGAATPAPPPAVAASLLSERELQVLRLLADGHRNREIADRLFVSETTVKAHLRNINIKLGAQSRTHAVAMARQLGLV